MDILTLELFEVTISEALREITRALEQHPALPLRILLGSDPMLRHNVQRLLVRLGRSAALHPDGAAWRLDVAAGSALAGSALAGSALAGSALAGSAAAESAPPASPGFRALAGSAPAMPVRPAAPRPLLLTGSRLGHGSAAVGHRLLLGVLRELDPAVPWVGLALEALELLEDPQSLAVLQALQARGTPVLVSRESQLFPPEPGGFEIMEDTRWQRLAGRGEITIL